MRVADVHYLIEKGLELSADNVLKQLSDQRVVGIGRIIVAKLAHIPDVRALALKFLDVVSSVHSHSDYKQND